MINLRILFGWIPASADYEASQTALRKEYSDLISFAQSKELAEYTELEKTVLSSDFTRRKKEILGPEIFRYARIPQGKGISFP